MCTSAADWAQHLRTVHVQAIEVYRTGALERILPVFAGIAEEADAAARAEFERLGAMPADPDGFVDMGDLAEQAQGHGEALYDTMRRLGQGVLNLLAVGLHHLFEQQQVSFFQQALATEENERFERRKLEERLAEQGIDAKSFGCAAKVHELRIAANAIKHGAGPAATQLAGLRPDLFQDPILAKVGWPRTNKERAQERAAALVAPLAGDDLYVTEDDLTSWCDATKEYWLQVATSLEALQQRQDAT